MNNNINVNSKSRKIKKSFITYLTLLIVSIISLFTFTACKLTSTTTTGSSAVYDADGKLRLSIPFVWHNTYSVDAAGKKIIDDVSGSFAWELNYYVKNATDEHYDQTSFEYCQFYYVDGVENFTVVNMMDNGETDTEIKKPIYAKSQSALFTAANACKSGDPINVENSSFVETPVYDSEIKKYFYTSTDFTEGWWQCIPAEGSTYKFCHVYTYTNYATVNTDTVAFPDYEIVVDGNFYTFKIICNYDQLGQYNEENIEKGLNAKNGNMFFDRKASTSDPLFTFKYRNGKSTSEGDEWKDCPAGFMTYYEEEGKFYIRFNPHLEKASTNRYLKVRSLLNSSADSESLRASSLYSSTLSFEAYAVSFEAYSPNSVEVDYGGIDYDHGKYYFASEKSVYDTKSEKPYIKSITGYFPEGRKIEVKRGVSYSTPTTYNNDGVPYTKDYNYAFQSWTTNAKADNTNVLASTLPARSIANNSAFTDTTNLQAFTLGDNPLNADTLSKSSQFTTVSIKNTYSAPFYIPKAYTTDDLSYFVYDYLPDMSASATTMDDRIVVTAHRYINGYKFYANYAKVRDFEISGTMFAGDNFFTGDNQYLTDFTPVLFVYKGDGKYEKLILNNHTETYSQSDLKLSGTNSHINGINLTINGSYFKLTGLEYNDYIIFEKEGKAINKDAALNPADNQTYLYSFHSPNMVDKYVADYGTQVKALQPFVSSVFFGDKQDMGIIGTQYSETSNLIVNLYATDDGNGKAVPDTGIKLLENTSTGYEVIKSVSTYEDKNGYVTTNVIISLMLPSNQSLIGYNVETMQNLAMQYYSTSKSDAYNKDSSDLFVVFKTFNPQTYKYENSDFYGNNISKGVKIKVNSDYVTDYPEFNIFFYEIKSEVIADSTIDKTTTSAYIQTEDGKYWKYMYKNNDLVLPGTRYEIVDEKKVPDTLYYYMQIDGNTNPYNDDGTYSASDIHMLVKIVHGNGASEWRKVDYIFSSYAFKDEMNADETMYKTWTTSITMDMDSLTTGSLLNDNNPANAEIPYQIVKAWSENNSYGNETGYPKPLHNVTEKITLTERAVSVVVDAYETGMKNKKGTDEQFIYVYYDVKKVNGLAYYISPVAMRFGDTYKLLFDEISNFGSLKGNAIMLGSDIIARKDLVEEVGNFYRAIGAKLSANSYYYILPVGKDAGATKSTTTTLLAKQYILDPTLKQTSTLRQVDNYTDKDGNAYVGTILKKLPDSAITNPQADVALSDESGLIISDDYTKLKTESGKYVLTDLSKEKTPKVNDLLSSSHDSVNNADDLIIDDKDTKLGDAVHKIGESGYPIYDVYSGSLLGNYGAADANIQFLTAPTGDLKYQYQLYLLDFSGDEINTVMINDLYFDGDKTCYKILGQTRLNGVEYDVYDHTEQFAYVLEFNPENFTIFSVSNELISKLKVKVTTKVQTGDNLVDKTYYGILIPTYYDLSLDAENNMISTQYFLTLSKSGAEDKLVYNFTMSGSSNYEYYKPLVNDDGSVQYNEDGTPKYDTSDSNTKLTYYSKFDYVYINQSGLNRTAIRFDNNNEVTILGKYISSNDPNNPIIYPSLSSFEEYEDEDLFVLNMSGVEGGVSQYNYYSLDYTSTNTVKEGFPGIVLLAGTPYPNPVLYLSVRHLASETPIINISFDIKPAYYVEVLGSNIQTEDSNLMRDFTTYAFKDTITNITQNDYLDNTYYVIDKETMSPIIPYYIMSESDYNNLTDAEKNKLKSDVGLVDGNYYFFYTYTTSQDENGIDVYSGYPLTIQDIGLNDDDMFVYYKDSLAANGKYTKFVYVKYYDNAHNVHFKTLNSDTDVNIWNSSPSKIEDVPIYDIHTYYQDRDGIIYFTSGTDTDDNVECIGLSGISAGATKSEYGYYNYDNVVLGGVTYAYRTLRSQIEGKTNYGYQFDKQISIIDAYDSKDAYFLTGVDAVVLMASPIVQIDDVNNNSYIYRFKEWKVYSRYNSELLYYNREITETMQRNGEAYNAILTFASKQAGYFVFLPVYQRVYKIDLGTAVIDGPINQGGGVTVLYSDDSRESDINNKQNHTLYMTEYLKTEYLGKQGYYYGNLTGIPYLYFTGDFYDKKPVFSYIDNVYYDNGDFYKVYTNASGKITSISKLEKVADSASALLRIGKPGIIQLSCNGMQYYAYYNEVDNNGNVTSSYIKYWNEDSELIFRYYDDYSYVYVNKTLKDIMGVTFTAKFFFDTVTGDSASKTVPVYYNKDNMTFSSLSSSLLSHISILNIFNAIGTIFKDHINEDIAVACTNNFTYIPVANPSISAEMYRSEFGTFAAGELAADENGVLYSTQQFKTTYIDRDAQVKLQAVPDNGYRVEGWYMCYYDEVAGTWVTTDDKVVNSDAKYFDEILQAYYNPYTREYYYITDYHSTGNATDDIRYYYDEARENLAVVPDRMLDKVRGYFVNMGSSSAPNWIQVYSNRNTGYERFYFDPDFTNRVDTNEYDVEEKTYLDVIHTWENGLVTLSNITIYKRVIDAGTEYEKAKYYRGTSKGNIYVDGNNLQITDLHANLRYVAKFIETYNEYIYTEDTEDGIQISAVYYYNNDRSIEKDEDNNDIAPTIRTNHYGDNKTSLFTSKSDENNKEGLDYIENQLDSDLFKLYSDETIAADESKRDKKLYAGYMNQTTEEGTKFYEGAYEYSNLLNGFGTNQNTYRVNEYDKDLGGNPTDKTDGKLNLKSMYFDVNTTVYIVVKVPVGDDLSMHTLGMNMSYTLNPVVYPTDDYISYNEKAKKDDNNKVDYLYYIFSVTYNRDPENEYVNYIVHPKRGNSVAYDALAGNYIEYYGKYFNYYDSGNRQITYTTETIGNKTKIKLTNSYLLSLKNAGIINEEIYEKCVSDSGYGYKNNGTQTDGSDGSPWFDNISKALEAINFERHKYGDLKVDHIEFSGNTDDTTLPDDYDSNGLKKSSDIIAAVRKLIKVNGKANPYLLINGYKNFINLSSLVIYTFTVQALTIDDYQYDGTVLPTYENGRVVLENNEYNAGTSFELANSVYVDAGMSEKTYVGSFDGYVQKDDEFLYTYMPNYNGDTPKGFKKQYTGLPYLLTGELTGENAENKTVTNDLGFVENTIILFEGINTDEQHYDSLKTKYAFVGWFEQKYDRVTKQWTNLELMSQDEKYPYLTLATEDTIIVAVYKRIVDVTITYDKEEVTLQMPNGYIDSLGKPLTIEDIEDGGVYDHTEVSGTFFFDTDFGMYLTLTGGYRFNGFSLSYLENQGNDIPYDNKCLSYKEYTEEINGEEKTIKYVDTNKNNVKLNGALYVSAPVSQAIMVDQKDIDAMEIKVNTQKLTLVYIEVDNYNTEYGSFAGLNYKLQKDGTTLFETNSSNSNSGFTVKKDSTNQPLNVQLENSKLIVSGYFDNTSNLKIITTKISGSTSEAQMWYINGCAMPTNSPQYADYNLNSNPNTYYTFDIKFEYADNESTTSIDESLLNNEENFALDKDNAVYYMKSIITNSHTVNFVHTVNDNASCLGTAKMGSLVNSESDLSVLSYNGIMYEGANEILNSSKALTKQSQNNFAWDAEFNVYVKYDYLYIGGNLYKFVGWFASNNAYQSGNSLKTLITKEKYFSVGTGSNWYSTYEAKYVKVSALFINDIEFAKVAFSGTTGSDDINVFGVVTNEDSILNVDADKTLVFNKTNTSWTTSPTDSDVVTNNYVLSGAEFVAKIMPDSGYMVDSFKVKNPLNATYRNSGEEYTISTSTLVSNPSYFDIEAKISKGYVLTINQLLFDNVNMKGDGTIIASPQIEIVYAGNNVKSVSPITFKTNQEITIKKDSTKDNYYFLGFYIDGVRVSGTGTSYTFNITRDTIIEVRFADYVNLKVNSYMYGTTTNVTSSYEFIYNDPLTGDLIGPYKNKNENKKVPAGITGEFTLINSGYSINKFVGWGLLSGGNVSKIYSTNTTADITINKTDADAENVVNIAALFNRVVKVTLSRSIDIGESDKEDENYYKNNKQTDLFKSLFDIKVTYYDENNVQQTVTLGSKDQLTDLNIKYDTELKIEILIDDTMKDKYDLTSLTTTQRGVEFVKSGNVYALSKVNNNLTIKTLFANVIKVQVNKELDGVVTNNSDLSVNTEFYDALGYEIYSSWNGSGSSTELSVPYNSYYKFSANSSINEFIGWYVGSSLISTEKEIKRDNIAYKFEQNVVLTAKFVSARTVTVYRYVNGGLSSNNNMAISLTGKVKENVTNGNEYNVKTVSIGSNASSLSTSVMNGSQIVLQATHISGYIFKGFKVNDNYITPKEHSYSTTAVTTVSGNSNNYIYAIYESAYTVSYVVTTIDGEDQTNEDGATLTNPTLFVSKSDTSVSFNIDLKVGYAVHAIYINGTKQNTYFISGNTYTLNLPENKSNLAIEIRIKKTLNLNVVVAVNESADKNVLTDQFNIDLSKLYINFNGNKIYLNTVTTATLLNNFDIILNSSYNVSVGVDGDTSSTPSFQANEITYYFNGLYIYDGISVATSVAPVSYKNAITFTANKNISIVAKFSDTDFGYDTTTKLTYEFMDDLSSDPTILTTFNGMVEDNNYTTYLSKQYIFIGYYARLNDVVNGTQYIKLSENYSDGLDAYNGVYANIVARFIKIYARQITIDAVNQTISSVSYLSTKVFAKIDENLLCPVIDNNKNLTITRLASSVLTVKNYVIDGYYIDQSGSKVYSRDYIYSADLSTNETVTETTVRIAVDTTVTAQDNVITAVVAALNTNNAVNTLVINNTNTSASVTFVVDNAGSVDSKMIVTIFNPADPDATITQTVVESYNITLQKGQIINITYSLADHERFNGYDITVGETVTHITSNDYTYTVNSPSLVTITALFNKLYELTLIENDYSKGNVNVVTNANGTKTIKIVANSNYAVSAINFVTMSNGIPTGTYYNILTNYDNVSDMFDDITSGEYADISNALNTKIYKSTVIYTFTLKQDIAFKVEYAHVAKVRYEVYAENSLKTAYQYNYFPSDSPLTLSDIEDLDLQTKIINDGHNYQIISYAYAGTQLDGSTSINITSLDNVIISVNCSKAYKIKLHINTIDSEDFTAYASKSGIKMTLDGDNVVSGNGSAMSASFESNIITYYLNNDAGLKVSDSKNNYEFMGYFAEAYTGTQTALTTSSAYKFTDVLFDTLTPDGDGVYHLYAGFMEIIKIISVSTNYISTFGNTFGLSFAYNDNFVHVTSGVNGFYTIYYIDNDEVINDELTITANGFTTNSTDPLMSFYGATEFYDHTYKNIKYRFTNFYDNFGNSLGTRYNNQVTLNLRKLSNVFSIIAITESLNRVQYTYDVADENIKISIQAYAGVNSSYVSAEKSEKTLLNTTTSGAIMQLFVENGTAVRINVNYNGYDGNFEYFAGKNSILAKDIYIYNNNHDEDITTLSGLALLKYDQVFGKGMEKSSYVTDKTSAYNFISTQDMSFIANFGSLTQDNKIISALLYNSDIFEICNILSNTVSDVFAIDGATFAFFNNNEIAVWETAVKTGITYTDANGYGYDYNFTNDKLNAITEEKTVDIYEEQTERKPVLIDNPEYDPTNKWSLKKILIVQEETKISKVGEITGPGTEVVAKQTNIIFVNSLAIPESPEMTAVKLIKRYDDLYRDKNLTYNQMLDANNNQLVTLTFNSNGDYWTVTAPVVDGYYFKGFLIASSGYFTSYPLILLNGEKDNFSAQNYTYLGYKPYDKNGNAVIDDTVEYSYFVSNPIKKEYGVSIYAVYEARIYVISLNMYEYKESNDELYPTKKEYSDIEKESAEIRKNYRMTKDEIYAGKVKGALLVERDDTAKLQASAFQYKQFVGWSTTEKYADNSYTVLIDADITSGTELGETADGEKVYSRADMSAQYAAKYIQTLDTNTKTISYENGAEQYKLKANAVTPGEIKNGAVWTNEYYSKLAKNNLYIYRMKTDLTLNVYFTALSYKLYITLTDIDTTVKSDAGQPDVSESYLAYADLVREQPGWTNPSAGTYTYTVNWGTDKNNNAKYQYEITIDDNDPFVYVWNDENNKEIGYPTKIAATRAYVFGNNESNTLNYIKGYTNEYPDAGVEIKIARPNGGSGTGEAKRDWKTLFEDVNTVNQKQYQEFLNNNDNATILKDKYDTFYLYGFMANVGTMSSNNYALSYIFDYLEFNESSKTWSFTNKNNNNDQRKENIFKIYINDQPISNEELVNNIQTDIEKGTINYVQKITAESSGFPDVKVEMFDNESGVSNVASIQELNFLDRFTRFGRNGLDSGELSEETASLTFSNNSIYDAELEDLGDINIRLLLKWQKIAKKVNATLTNTSRDDNKTITLTAGNNYGKTWLNNNSIRNAWMKTDSTYTDGGAEGKSALSGYNNNFRSSLNETNKDCYDYSEIQAYFVIIIENVYDIINKLTWIANNKSGNDKDKAVEYIGLILGNARTFLNENKKGQISGLGNGLNGQLFPNSSDDIRKNIVGLINKHFRMELKANEILKFHMIDVYEYYVKGLSASVFNNCCISGNDMVISVCLLQEHNRNMYNTSYFRFLWTTNLWSAERGYDFYRNASMTYSAGAGNGANNSGSEQFTQSYTGTYNNTDLRNYYYQDARKLDDNFKAAKDTWNRQQQVNNETLNYLAYKYALDYRQSDAYMRVINAAEFLNRRDFTNSTIKAINSEVIINVSPDVVCKSMAHAYMETPFNIFLIGLGTGAAYGALTGAAVSGGFAAAFGGLLGALLGGFTAMKLASQSISYGISSYRVSNMR